MKRRGVSLIVLIITVIVVIILAVTVILTLSKNNPIESAKEATFKEDVRAYQDELNMYIAREYQQTQGMRDWKITATKYEKDSSNEEYNKSVYKYLNSFKKKYENKLAIKEDKIAYVGNDEKEKEWLVNSGVYVAKQFTVRYVDGNGNDLLPQEEIAQLDIEYTFYPKTIDGYVPMQDEISGVTSENTSITFEYCQICNDLLFIGLDSSGNETSDESSIVAYTVGGIGNCNNPYIAIPSTYNNKSVAKMKNEAFKNNALLKYVIIPDSIDTVAYREFWGSTRLNKVKTNTKTVASQAFAACGNLESVELGSNVEAINSGAFLSCGKLKNFTINSEKITIGERIFYGSNLIDEIHINSDNNAYTVVDGVLYTKDMKNLVLVPPNKQGKYTLPNGLQKIMSYSCSDCKIEEFENIEGIETIDYRAFWSSTGLNKVKINTKTVASQAFAACGNLESVELGSNVEAINSGAFLSCGKLKNFTINSEKITIGERIFYGSNLIDEIHINSDNNAYTVVDGVLYTKDMKNLVLVPPNKQGKYTLPNGLQKIMSYSCSDCKIEEFENIEGIETIDYRAFWSSTGLNKVKINTKTVASQTFAACGNLESVELGSNVEAINSNAFYGCSKLKSVQYNGTKEQWNAISKNGWNNNSSITKIICTDGEIQL